MKNTESNTPLPDAFIHYWQTLVYRCESARMAHHILLRGWRQGQSIPGYEQPPKEREKARLPLGWSYRNLLKHCPAPVEVMCLLPSKD